MSENPKKMVKIVNIEEEKIQVAATGLVPRTA